MKRNKFLTTAIAATMVMGNAIPVFAATSHNADSVGSVAEDITNTTKVGQDTVQSQASSYSDELTGDITNEATESCEAYLTKASTFSVVIPKKVVLDGKATTGNVGNYTVSVKGNIAGDDIITVAPVASFQLKQSGKKDVVATVAQPKTTFQINDGQVTETNVEVGNTTPGSISVEKITSGSWKGIFNFNISLDTKTAIVTP